MKNLVINRVKLGCISVTNSLGTNVLCVLSVLLVIFYAALSFAQNQPNIIVILSDDQGIDAVEGANWPNNLNCHTPNISALANQGRIFVNARVQPYCSPTRAGIMSGRSGLRTGVIGVVSRQEAAIPDRDLVSLQGYETTIAEVLKDVGYYTIHIDKWHCGYNSQMGQRPEQQGFMVVHNRNDYYYLDDPDTVGDEHISRMVNLSVDEVNNRPDPNQPYALFFWTIEPHKKYNPDSNGFWWWRVDESLLPSGSNYYNANPRNDTEVDRYRATVEALDTEIGRMLNELGVVNSSMQYRRNSNTLVIYLGDNGTPQEVAPVPDHAKGSGYEGGIRVPFFVMGENVPDDGAVLDRLVNHEDIFETIADIVEATPQQRGSAPRNSYSFADSIGWSQNPLPQREFTLSNVARVSYNDQYVVLADKQYKLFAKAGGPYLDPLSGDEFYDLSSDPNELDDLNKSHMKPAQKAAYYNMRDKITNYWNTSVSNPFKLIVDVPITDMLRIDEDDDTSTKTFRVGFRDLDRWPDHHRESRGLIRFDIQKIDNLLPPNKKFSDIIDAQLLIGFKEDSTSSSNNDTGVISVHQLDVDWYNHNPRFRDIENNFDPAVCGFVDLPPYIVTNPGGDGNTILAGIPLSFGTPLSFGQSTNLLDLVTYWHNNPSKNHGVVLMAEPLFDRLGDQRVTFLNIAALRLTLSP